MSGNKTSQFIKERRNAGARSSGKMDRYGGTLQERRARHQAQIDAQIAEVASDLQSVAQLLEQTKAQFMRARNSDPAGAKTRVLNIIVNSLATAVNKGTAECRRLKNSGYDCY